MKETPTHTRTANNERQTNRNSVSCLRVLFNDRVDFVFVWRRNHGFVMKETEILALLDKALVNISSRELVASNEMQDLLLDIRLHLMTAESASVANTAGLS